MAIITPFVQVGTYPTRNFQKDTLLTQMNAKVNTLLVDRANLSQRLERYQSTLLPQVQARIHAVETELPRLYRLVMRQQFGLLEQPHGSW